MPDMSEQGIKGQPITRKALSSLVIGRGSLQDNLHQFAEGSFDDDNESSLGGSESSVESESNHSEDTHSVYEFDENDIGTWLDGRKVKQPPMGNSTTINPGIAAADSLPPQVLSFYKNVTEGSDDDGMRDKVELSVSEDESSGALNLYLNNVEADSDEEDNVQKPPSAKIGLNRAAAHKEPHQKSPAKDSTEIDPFLLGAEESSDHGDCENDDNHDRSTATKGQDIKLSPQNSVSKQSSSKIQFSLGTIGNSASIESSIDPTTEMLLLDSVKRARSFNEDTFDEMFLAGKDSVLQIKSASDTSSVASSVVNKPLSPKTAVPTAEPQPPQVLERPSLEAIEIDVPTVQDIDDLFAELSDLKISIESDMKRIDEDSKIAESQLQLLVDDTDESPSEIDAEKKYGHLKARIVKLGSQKEASLRACFEDRLLKIKEVRNLIRDGAVSIKRDIIAEENKCKAFQSLHNSNPSVDQVYLKAVCLSREQELRRMFDESDVVMTKLEAFDKLDHEISKIRERFEAISYFIPEWKPRVAEAVKTAPPLSASPPPPPPPVMTPKRTLSTSPIAAAKIPEKKTPEISPVSSNIIKKMIDTTPVTAVKSPEESFVDTPVLLESKLESPSSTAVSAPTAASVIATPTTVDGGGEDDDNGLAMARAAAAAMITPTTKKKKLNGELGALVNEVLVRRGSASPYGVPPKRAKEEDGGNNNADETPKEMVPIKAGSTPNGSTLSSLFIIDTSSPVPDGIASNNVPFSTSTSADHLPTLLNIHPFTPVRRHSELESNGETDDRASVSTPVPMEGGGFVVHKRLSTSDRKKSRSSMQGLQSPMPNTEAIRAVTSLTKSLKKKYTSDNLSSLVAQTRAAAQSPTPTTPAADANAAKEALLKKSPEKEELPELEDVLDLPDFEITLPAAAPSANSPTVPQSSLQSSPNKPGEVGLRRQTSAENKTLLISLRPNGSSFTSAANSPVPSATVSSPAPATPPGAPSASIGSHFSSIPPVTLTGGTTPQARSSSSTPTNANSTNNANATASSVQPKTIYKKLEPTISMQTLQDEDLVIIERFGGQEDPDVNDEGKASNMRYFYQKLLDTVGDGIRPGVLRVFRIMEITLATATSTPLTNAISNVPTIHTTRSAGSDSNSTTPSHRGRRSSVASGSSVTPRNNSTAITPIRRKAHLNHQNQHQQHHNDNASEMSRSPSNDTLASGDRGRKESPEKPYMKSHVQILPQVAFYDTKILLDILSQQNFNNQVDLQLKHHAMVMLSNTLHLNNLEDMMQHVRALQEAHAVWSNASPDSELVSGKFWDMSQLFQAAKILIHLFGTEAAHGRSSITSLNEHERALTTEASLAYQALKTLRDELQSALLAQAALNNNGSRRRTDSAADSLGAPSPRSSMIRGSFSQPSGRNNTPLTLPNLMAESDALRAQMLVNLLPHNMAIIEIMVKLIAFRDSLLVQCRQYKSLGRREIYRYLKKFVQAIDQQLEVDVHARNMEIESRFQPLTSQIASALEELDRLEAESKTASVPGTSYANPGHMSLSLKMIGAFADSALHTGINNNHNGNNPASQSNSGKQHPMAGKFVLDRMRSLVVQSEDLCQRMRMLKETMLSLAAHDSQSDTDEDEYDAQRIADDLSSNHDSSHLLFGFSSPSPVPPYTVAGSEHATYLYNHPPHQQRHVSSRTQRLRNKEQLDKAIQETVACKDELKKKVTVMMVSIADEVDLLIKTHVLEDNLANKFLEATFRREETSIAVLLLRAKSAPLLRSIYATWPGLSFEIAIVESGNSSGPLSISRRNAESYGSGVSLTSPTMTTMGRSGSNSQMLRNGLFSPTTNSINRTRSPMKTIYSFDQSDNHSVRDQSLPNQHPTPRTPGGGLLSQSQTHGLLSVSPPASRSTLFLQQQAGIGNANAAVETVYQRHLAKDLDTTVVDFTDTKLLRILGFKLTQLRDSRCYTWTDLLNAGYPLQEIKPLRAAAAASGSSTSATGSGVATSTVAESQDPKQLVRFKLSVDELRHAGYSIEQCLQAGFDATALRTGGFNELQLVQSGLFSMKQLKKAGCDVQRFALKSLYEATDGKHWRRKDNWCSNRPLGEWYGVKVDSRGNVIRIDLRSNELSGKHAVNLMS